ncbi:hypothetical protein OK016_04970 [Vibrio chagasii]|nr:hypothetical protein [Vibrio chagasii]
MQSKDKLQFMGIANYSEDGDLHIQISALPGRELEVFGTRKWYIPGMTPMNLN